MKAAKYEVATVLVHRDDNPRHPDARRIINRAVTPGEWGWMRLTGLSGGIPRQHSDLADWARQDLRDLAFVLGHPAPQASW